MGATIQRTRYSNTTKKVLQDDTAVTGSDDVKVVSGLNLLTNNQVCNEHRHSGAILLNDVYLFHERSILLLRSSPLL